MKKFNFLIPLIILLVSISSLKAQKLTQAENNDIATKMIPIHLLILDDDFYFTSKNIVNIDEDKNTVITLHATGDGITYSISGTDASKFSVDTDTGVVSPVSPLSYETQRSYTFTATATDAHGKSITQTVTIKLKITLLALHTTTHGTELWRTNGKVNGTKKVKDINTKPTGSSTDSGQVDNIVKVGDIYFFTANDGIHGKELWKSDGTEAGTVMVKDIVPGNSGSYIHFLTNVNGTLYFGSHDNIMQQNTKLWKSDGTKAGTIMVKEILMLATSPSAHSLTNLNGTLYFISHGEEYYGDALWKSNGTKASTVMVKDIRIDSNLYALTNVNGTLYFIADDELWKSNGTKSGTVKVTNIYNPSYYYHLTSVNDTLYFTAEDKATHTYGLWKSNGTKTGTIMVKGIVSSVSYAYPYYLTNVNGTLYFIGTDNTHGAELWKSDGTETGTVMVKDITSGTMGSDIKIKSTLKGELLFTVRRGNNKGLWKSDGTEAGTVKIKDGVE